MKNFKISIIAIALCMTLFNSCSKKNDPSSDLQTSTFNGKITAKVENGTASSSVSVLAVMDLNYTDNTITGENMGEGSYTNGGFTITLVNTVDSQYLKNIGDFLDTQGLSTASNIKISNPDALINSIDILGIGDDNLACDLFYYVSNTSDPVWAGICYVDRDVTVTATGVTVSLKKGWNYVYTSGNSITTKAPSGMKWYRAADITN